MHYKATAWTAIKLSKPLAFNEVEARHHLLGYLTIKHYSRLCSAGTDWRLDFSVQGKGIK